MLLASTSKVPAVMTLMALQEDANVDFSMSEPVSTYLAHDGPCGSNSRADGSNTGHSRLRLLVGYGSREGPTAEDLITSVNSALNPSLTLRPVAKIRAKRAPTSQPAKRDHGGSQWQIAGVTASTVANATWNQLVDQYLGTLWLEVLPWQPLGITHFLYRIGRYACGHEQPHR